MNAIKSLLVLGALLPGCTMHATAEPPGGQAEFAFESHEITTGFTPRQTVFSGFLLGGEFADLGVVHIDEDGDRRLRIYSFADGAWVPSLGAKLRSGVLFVGLVNIGREDRLMTYEPGHLNWFDASSMTERPLLDIEMHYRATADDVVPLVDISRDLNDDGRDDLVFPGVEGFRIAIQLSDGSFSQLLNYGPPEPFADHPLGNLDTGDPAGNESTTYGGLGITDKTIPVYLERAHGMDHDLDGRRDLVFWNEGQFDVYHQGPGGLFNPVAQTVSVDVPIDFDGIYSRAFEYVDKGVFSTVVGIGGRTRRTVLHSLRDMNGDGLSDLVTQTLTGRSITKQRSVFEFHFGSATPDGTVFASEAGAAVRLRGKAGAIQPWGYSTQWFEDFDSDGQVDIMVRDVVVGLGGMSRALVGNSVPVNIEYYQGGDGSYPGKPSGRLKVRRFAPFAGVGNIFFPPVLLGDVNGDGRSDLVVGESPDELQIFPGISGPGLFGHRAHKFPVGVPNDEGNTWLTDLNRDGRQDIILHRAPTDHAPNVPHRVTILISN